MPGVQNAKKLNEEKVLATYKPSDDRKAIGDFVFKRMEEMKNFRKELKIEEEWKEADDEILPAPLTAGDTRTRLVSDDELGLRSRAVPIGDETQAWRSDNSDPTLLVKIQTALSIIIDTTPEAVLRPTLKKFEKTAAIARALWERNWDISGAKNVYKLLAFDQFKYGWMAGRVYPRDVRFPKKFLETFDSENPEQSTFTDGEVVLYSDIFRERLDPRGVWLDPNAKPYDILSRNEVYYEVEIGADVAEAEYGEYEGWGAVDVNLKGDESDTTMVSDAESSKEKHGIKRKVTIGFYENRAKDLFAITVPRQNIVLYYSPLPNDDALLSVFDAPLILRSADSPYGVSLWRIIKQDKELYDKMKNMTMDQLVLSIMKMGFLSGGGTIATEGNVVKIVPGQFKEMPASGKVDWLEVPGPGSDSFDGLRFLKSIIDDNSGITPTLEGKVEGSGTTLGAILHAKESALKRLRTPLENLAAAMEQDAQLTLSWIPQLYSTPEVKSFVDLTTLTEFERENELSRYQLFEKVDDDGQPAGYDATFLPQLSLKLEDKNGKLVESKNERFFQIGKDIQVNQLRWRGLVKIVTRSIVSSSVELEKQKKMEMFNILAPLLPQPPEIFAKAAKQLCLANDEKYEEWLPDNYVEYLRGEYEKKLFLPPTVVTDDDGNQTIVPQTGGAAPMMSTGGERMEGGFESMQGLSGVTPNTGAPTVVPQSQIGGEGVGTLSESMGNALGR